MTNFKKGQKVTLTIKSVLKTYTFTRTVNYVEKGMVYLAEGGSAFDATTGKSLENINARIA